MKKNLALTGMMGVGKSTLGKALSKELLMQFSDIDKIIENKLKMSIQNSTDGTGGWAIQRSAKGAHAPPFQKLTPHNSTRIT